METISIIGSPHKFICRICHEKVSDEEGGNVCNCSGSIKFVHMTCLEKWLSVNGNDSCELCGTKFQVTKLNPSFKQVSTNSIRIAYDIVSIPHKDFLHFHFSG